MKKKLVFACVLLLSVIFNIIPVFILKNNISISRHSYIPLIIMTLVSANGILSYFLRHKGNFLAFGKPRGSALSSDKNYTFTTQYQNEFYWMFLIYCVTIPFYIPCIFFTTKWIHTLWTLCILATPQVIYIIHGISQTLKDINEYQAEKQKRDQQLKEQQRREEMGHFK